MGVGSAVNRKLLFRVQGPTTDPADDVLLEAKQVTSLDGISCLESPTTQRALRIIDGTRQLGGIKHDILAARPSLLVPSTADRAEHWHGGDGRSVSHRNGPRIGSRPAP